MNLNETIPADAGGTCACCGRTHRKLYPKSGRMVGESCRKNIELAQVWGIPALSDYSETAAKRVASFLGVQLDFMGRCGHAVVA